MPSPGLLPLLSLALVSCESSRPRALQLQYAQVGDLDKPSHAIGASFHQLGSDENPVGWFVDMRIAADGTLRGLEFEDPPPAAPSHPVTGEATTAIDAHVGPTVRAMDGLWFHAGIGVGYMQSATERFDASTIGYYHYDEGPTLHGSLTAGGLWKPTEGIALGVGYDLFFDAVVFGVGVTF
ncbi:MAG: hypothetical protein RIT24_2145 [Planctomycetota bacterium]